MSVFAVLALAVLVQTPEEHHSVPSAEARLAAEVEHLFLDRCASCHTPDADERKARRKWDGARDLAATREELVEPGDLLLSDLWAVLEEGDMPPDDSDVPPLEEWELALVRTWIEAGAPLGGDAEVVRPPPPPPPSLGRRALTLAGRQHVRLVHFPIALLLSAALARMLSWSTHRGPRGRSLLTLLRTAEGWSLALGALGALAAAPTGWLRAEELAPESDLTLHRWLGVATAAASLLLLAAFARHREKRAFGLALLALAGLTAVAAHFGGLLAWGESYFSV